MFFHISIEYSVSNESRVIYAKRDAYLQRIVQNMVIVLLSLVLWAYLPSELCCLSTIIFGVPSSKYWATALYTDEAYAKPHTFRSFVQCCSCFSWNLWWPFFPLLSYYSLPDLTHTPVIFEVALIVESLLIEMCMVACILLLVFIVCICLYLWSIVDDLSGIVGQNDVDIERCISIKTEFLRFIKLHAHFYKYFIREFAQFTQLICIFKKMFFSFLSLDW